MSPSSSVLFYLNGVKGYSGKEPTFKNSSRQKVYSNKEINMIFQLFYEKLYRSEIYSSVESDMESFFEWPEHTQKLKPLLKPYVNKPIGLTSEFYKEFEDLVVPPLLRNKPFNHHQCATSTWMMWRLSQDNGASALTTHQLQVERREDGDY